MSLEGKYFGFGYVDNVLLNLEIVSDWIGLAIFQLINWKLEKIFDPCVYRKEEIEADDRLVYRIELALKQLEELWADELYSTLSTRQRKNKDMFLWLKMTSDHIDDWYNYSWLYNETDKFWKAAFEAYWIEIKEYTE